MDAKKMLKVEIMKGYKQGADDAVSSSIESFDHVKKQCGDISLPISEIILILQRERDSNEEIQTIEISKILAS